MSDDTCNSHKQVFSRACFPYLFPYAIIDTSLSVTMAKGHPTQAIKTNSREVWYCERHLLICLHEGTICYNRNILHSLWQCCSHCVSQVTSHFICTLMVFLVYKVQCNTVEGTKNSHLFHVKKVKIIFLHCLIHDLR